MGKEIVREEFNDFGEREFFVDLKEICYVFSNIIVSLFVRFLYYLFKYKIFYLIKMSCVFFC